MRLARPEDALTERIIGIAIEIHRNLAPGLFESVYETVLDKKLREAGFRVERQKPIPLIYEELYFDKVFQADLIVNGSVLREIKSVEELSKLHKKQVVTYLKLSGLRVGLLMNFNSHTLV